MNLLIIISVINITLYLVLTGLVLTVWKYGKAQRRFFFLLLTSACWFIIILLEAIIQNDFSLYALLGKIDFSFAALIAFLFLIFAFHFPRENHRLTVRKEILLFVPIFSLIILTFRGVFFEARDFNDYVYNNFWYIVYIFVLISYFVIFGAGILVKKYIRSQGLLKLQLQYLILGYIISISSLLYLSIHNALISSVTDQGWMVFTPVGIVFAISTSYVILRYRLMDIRLVIRKGVTHLISLMIIIALYTYIVLFIQDYFKANRILTTLIAVLVIALTFYPFRKWLFQAIDRLFYKEELEKTKRINELISKLPKVTEYDEILEEIYKVIFQNLKMENIRILISNREKRIFELAFPPDAKKSIIPEDDSLIRYLTKDKTILVREEIPYLMEKADQPEVTDLKDLEIDLKTLKAEVAVALREENLLGLILLGPKKSKDAFTVQDIEFLKNLSKEASIGLANVLLYKHTIEGLKRRIEKGEIEV